MKPPHRTRNKPQCNLKPEPPPQHSGKLISKWQRAEQRKLLNALKKLSKTTGGCRDIDYAFLRKYVPTRSVSEVHSVVESLKDKVISLASFELKKKRWEEKKVTKPIEMWTHLASALTGTLEEPISTAFFQMLMVSSTEPRTLRNRDPPQIHRIPTDRPVGRTVPLRPMPGLPVQDQTPGTNTVWPFHKVKIPAATMDPVVIVPNSKITQPQQPLSTTAGPSAQNVGTSVTQTTQQPSEQRPTPLSTTSTSKPTPPSPYMPLSSSATSVTPVPSTTPSSVASSSSATSSPSMLPVGTPAAEFHAKFGRISKYATKDSPRMFGVQCIVDFERIYRYLSVIHKPNEECHLTPMESAIVLDLLKSLPEELPLLDCHKLHKHLIQVHQCLSSPADSKTAREMFQHLKDEFGAQTETLSSLDGQQNTAGTAESSDVTDNGGREPQPEKVQSQSSRNSNTPSQSGDTDVMLSPPLNPFMIPLKLLRRK
uniref:snRNA-activating protein complex subunit 2 n=1 Tax=Scatophagus argus TaxID=75038 RepID=UPI001ED7D928|nr:snRNA-activating protein complex subunit 2 [Scatophagus argus]